MVFYIQLDNKLGIYHFHTRFNFIKFILGRIQKIIAY
jgi:hypothetical protein